MFPCLTYSTSRLIRGGNLQMFGVTGAGLASVRYLSNNHKKPRRGLDMWDRQSKEFLNITEVMAHAK
jgi:NADH-ubiquinone oxidoreductase MWFE subunit